MGFWGEALTAVRSKCICPRLNIRRPWGKTGRCVWGLRPSWYKPGSGEVLGGPGARVPQREARLCILEKGSLFHFEDANESTDTDASLIYPESCPRRNSTWAMNSSRKHPFSREQNGQLRELLWSAERGRQPWDGGWVARAPAAAVELGVDGRPATAQGLPSGGGGAGPPGGQPSMGQSGLCGWGWRVHLKAGPPATRQSRELCSQWPPSRGVDRNRKQPDPVLL